MAAKLKVLLATGVVSREHNYRLINDMLRTLIESTGRFDVRISEEVHGMTPRTLSEYDVVLLNYDGKYDTMGPTNRLDDASLETLFSHTAGGRGAAFFHSSLWIDETWPDEYRKLAGGYLSGKDGSRKNPKSDALVFTKDPEHPISRGAAKEWMAVEDDFFTGVFWHPEAKQHVLVTVADPVSDYICVPGFADRYQPEGRKEEDFSALPKIGEEAPVIWTNEYGKGRVFCSSLGHSDGTIKRVNYLTMFVRGLEWAATGEVTIDFPDRKGDKARLPWPFYQMDYAPKC